MCYIDIFNYKESHHKYLFITIPFMIDLSNQLICKQYNILSIIFIIRWEWELFKTFIRLS